METTGFDLTHATSLPIKKSLSLRARSLELLEFPAVLAQVGNYASSILGREGVLALVPSSNQDDVSRWQQETAEARLFIESRGVMDVSEATDVRLVVRRAAKEGILTGMELCTIAETLRAGRSVRTTFQRRIRDCPALAEIAGRIPVLDSQESNITRALSKYGEVEDAASSALREYRSQGRIAYGRLEEMLQRMIRSDRDRNVLQERVARIETTIGIELPQISGSLDKINDHLEKLNDRTAKLEGWKQWVLGGMAGLGIIITLIGLGVL